MAAAWATAAEAAAIAIALFMVACGEDMGALLAIEVKWPGNEEFLVGRGWWICGIQAKVAVQESDDEGGLEEVTRHGNGKRTKVLVP